MDTIIIILLLIILAEVTIITFKASARKVGKRTSRPMFVDTSVLIDGRIVAIARSGFVSDVLMVPRSVIGELQFLADNGDTEKRARARHGLDVVTELQALDQVSVEIFPDGSHAQEGVDERLLKLAKEHRGALCTIDYNLNKVAQVEGIPVVNVNDLAKSLRMSYLPGEKLTIALTTKGNDNTQAVGHLEDGTMVVVEQAKSKIGSTAEVEVIRSLQTAAGRMMFARLVGAVAKPQKTKREEVQASEKKSSADKVRAVRKQASAKGRQKTEHVAAVPPVDEKPSRKKVTTAPKRQNTKRSSRSSSSNEDRLIELVNNQK